MAPSKLNVMCWGRLLQNMTKLHETIQAAGAHGDCVVIEYEPTPYRCCFNPNLTPSNLNIWPWNPKTMSFLGKVWKLCDHSFLSYAPDKQTNRQTDGLEHLLPTPTDRVGVGNRPKFYDRPTSTMLLVPKNRTICLNLLKLCTENTVVLFFLDTM